MSRHRFVAAFRERPLLLDAAMGTRLMDRGLDDERDDPSLWCLDHPEVVADIHEADIDAGSDVLLSNTFGANRLWLDRFGRSGDVVAVNRRAVAIARDAAGPSRFVLGSIGPTASEGEAVACVEQAALLEEAGVDALILETHTFEAARRSLNAIMRGTSLPIVVSLCTWPDATEEAARRLIEAGGVAIGSNCGTSPEGVLGMTEKLAGNPHFPLIAKPSGFFPQAPDKGPETFAAATRKLLGLGTNLIGGCCGTDERYVAVMRKVIDEFLAARSG